MTPDRLDKIVISGRKDGVFKLLKISGRFDKFKIAANINNAVKDTVYVRSKICYRDKEYVVFNCWMRYWQGFVTLPTRRPSVNEIFFRMVFGEDETGVWAEWIPTTNDSWLSSTRGILHRLSKPLTNKDVRDMLGFTKHVYEMHDEYPIIPGESVRVQGDVVMRVESYEPYTPPKQVEQAQYLYMPGSPDAFGNWVQNNTQNLPFVMTGSQMIPLTPDMDIVPLVAIPPNDTPPEDYMDRYILNDHVIEIPDSRVIKRNPVLINVYKDSVCKISHPEHGVTEFKIKRGSYDVWRIATRG